MLQKYSFDSVLAMALQYKSRRDFEKNARPYYAAAHRNGWLDKVCGHMEATKTSWTKESVLSASEKCSSISDFLKKFPGAYKHAARHGYLDLVKKVYNKIKLPKWNEQSLIEEASKYSTLEEFKLKNPAAYSGASRAKLLDKVKQVLPKTPRKAPNRKWTFELCVQKIIECKSRNGFMSKYAGAYRFLQEHNRLQEAFDMADMGYMSGTSNFEQEILEWINSLGLKAEHKKRIGRSEIDILLTDLNIGIECNGLYWHSELFKGQKYHKNKSEIAKQSGIELIHIFEDQWRDRNKQVKGYLSSKFGINHRLYARDTKAKHISPADARKFFEENHIQGAPQQIELAIGLFHGNNIVAAMSFGKHHRNHIDKTATVLNRLCFKSGINVLGGAQKLLKNSKKELVMRGYKKIISWSDDSLSSGRVYRGLGFTEEEKIAPDYSYIKGLNRFSKQSLKKTPEERITGKTEKELRAEQGYVRIWDCGKTRWIMTI